MSESEEESEHFCFYGKPLEPYDEDTIPRKRPITVEEQIATDAQGRRRFHGAFTGGFSAGFFNTVGSLEGWLPGEFKSSRSFLWCGPCKALEPRLENVIAQRKGDISLAKVDIDDLGELAAKYEVSTIPALVVFQNGKVKERLIGLQDEDKLNLWIDNVLKK